MMTRKWVKSEKKSHFSRIFYVTLSSFHPLGPRNLFGKLRSSYTMRTKCAISDEIALLRTVLVWLSTCIPYQQNIVSDYAITQYRTVASEIAHFVRIV